MSAPNSAKVTLDNTWLVFVVYSKKRIENKKHRFVSLFNLFSVFDLTGITIVNNSKDISNEWLAEQFSISHSNVVIGTNTHAEFSGWIDGIACIQQKLDSTTPPQVLLINDTVFSHYPLFLKETLHFLLAISQQSDTEGPVIVGDVHTMTEKQCEVMSLPLPQFVRTAFFFMNSEACELFVNQCQRVFDSWLSVDIRNTDSFTLLSHFYNEAGAYYIGNWLFSGGWYEAKTFAQFDKTLLKIKLTSIVCEHSSSARILSTGGNIEGYNKNAPLNLLKRFTLRQLRSIFLFKLNRI